MTSNQLIKVLVYRAGYSLACCDPHSAPRAPHSSSHSVDIA